MKYIRCDFGHYYDPSKHESCPHCAAFRGAAEPEVTVAKSAVDEQVIRAYDLAPETPSEPESLGKKVAPASAERNMEEQDDPVTVAQIVRDVGFEPVVGWLVEIGGPNRGQSFEIHSERNTIGRQTGMDICLKGDIGISRDTNGVLSYNPRNREFHLIPGEGKAIIYVNGNELLSPVRLGAYDRIEISETTLLFLPLCGEQFAWED